MVLSLAHPHLSRLAGRLRGDAVAVEQAIEAHPSLRVRLTPPPRSIGFDSVVDWDDWAARQRAGKDGWATVQEWRPDPQRGEFSRFRRVPALMSLVESHHFEHWRGELQQIEGLWASKSNLNQFPSLRAMVETNSPELIQDVSPAALKKLLNHSETKLTHFGDRSQTVIRHAWDGRLFWSNSGGSHHLAAAQYVAAELGQPVPIQGHLKVYRFNPEAVYRLRDEFEMFVVSAKPQSALALHKALSADRAIRLEMDMPGAYGSTQLLLLPRDNPRSMKVAQTLREYGFEDMGAHLSGLVDIQTRLASAPATPSPSTSHFEPDDLDAETPGLN